VSDRREDVPALVEYFLRRQATASAAQPPRVTSGAMQRLVDYEWPGNVREIKTTVDRLVVGSPTGGDIRAEHLPQEILRYQRGLTAPPSISA
jgi:DNA-binding NtrC family response regulator